MSRSSRKKDKYGHRSEFSHDDLNEGTAARTRPFSFNEIMLRRKNKKQSGDVEEKISEKNVVKNAESEDFVKVRSRKRDDERSIKNVKLDKSRLRSVVDKSKIGDNPKGGKRKNDESVDFENEPEKRHSRDFVVKDKYEDRSRGKFEKETKRKSRYEDDERSRERDSLKKHESRKWHNSEFSERKEKKESSSLQFHHEEPRQKRRWSRSRDRNDKDKSRRSLSLSPKEHKRTSYNGKGPPSRLGGYSPRKRRTEAAIKTPSPTNHRSPEKKSATWDLPPIGKESNFTVSVPSNLGSSNQVVSESVRVGPTTLNTQKKPVIGIPSGAPSPMNASVDSIQLTQATRPMRRLYVENLPASASEEALKDCLNDFLVSSGVNLIQGTKPCISCIINKEKGQALAEFLTPEDATNALSFNGRSFSGSVLKIRRPKDFVDVAVKMFDPPQMINIHSKSGGFIPFQLTTAFRNAAEFLVTRWGFLDQNTVAIFMQTGGDPEKSVAAPESVSDIVHDSLHKIFIGGVSKFISSEMLKEIASAFGRLKAYHFEVNEDRNEPCAFLEYADDSVTPKACAGLNGMKLGGQMLTVVQAIPNASPLMENIGKPPLYGIPEHAKPLLEKPTQVLKLKNMLDPRSLSSLSEPELEEILEDVRLECARFGTVKSVNVIKHSNISTTLEEREAVDSAIDGHNSDHDDKKKSTEIIEEPEEITTAVDTNVNFEDKLDIKSEPSTTPGRPDDHQSTDNVVKDEIFEQTTVDSVEDPTFQETSGAVSGEPNASTDPQNHDQEVADTKTGDHETENKPSVKEEMILEDKDGNSKADCGEEPGFSIKGENREWANHEENVFEVGCILVEYRRVEASSTAAHCLHGRLFDSRIVTAEYVDLDLYKVRFPK